MENATNHFPKTTMYSTPTSTQKGVDALEPRKNDRPAMANLRKRMQEVEAKNIYKQRGCTAEFVNAVTKTRGMSEFLIRGIANVTNMALLYALTHNMLVFFRS